MATKTLKFGNHDYVFASQADAVTAADGGTVDVTYGAEEQAVVQNLVTRQAEIVAALEAVGIIASA